jgi:pimeloyl-ACP methyl ester carboxylesterase
VGGGVVDLYLRREAHMSYRGYDECFASGVDRNQAALLFATQRPAALNQFFEASGPPAWATIPSWSLIGTADNVITPTQAQAMSTHAGATISTVIAGHLPLVTRPNALIQVIQAAVDAST